MNGTSGSLLYIVGESNDRHFLIGGTGGLSRGYATPACAEEGDRLISRLGGMKAAS